MLETLWALCTHVDTLYSNEYTYLVLIYIAKDEAFLQTLALGFAAALRRTFSFNVESKDKAKQENTKERDGSLSDGKHVIIRLLK